MTDRRFAISLHILTLMSKNMGQWISSGYIAQSININPVLVRKELSSLRRQGLVETREGKNGGSRLKKQPGEIPLSEVYAGICNQTVLGKLVENPNPDCPVGRQINSAIGQLEKRIELEIADNLGLQTLADFEAEFE